MERIPQAGGDTNQPAELQSSIPPHPEATSEVGASWDERVICEGIEAALNEGRSVDNRTARYIAAQLHGGQASGLYALASSGAIADHVVSELVTERGQQSPAIQMWIDALIVYCTDRPDSGPVTNWVEHAEELDRAELVGQLNAVGIPLGQVAIIEGPGLTPNTNPTPDEEDHFHWDDAARWSPADDSEAVIAQPPGLSAEQLDALLGDGADEEVGDVQDLGWYGLIRWPEEPGGLILMLDDQGRRQTWVLRENDVLAARWTTITNAYAAFYEQREAYENATFEAGDRYRGINPRVWVGSLADYNNGYLHGEWFDATCDGEELELATHFMLRGSREPNAQEWAVMDYDGFGPLHLGEYVSFETISRIANGIAEHGEAFAAWAAHVGPEGHDSLDRFEDHYRGEWESFEAYIEDYLQETDFYRFLDSVPEDMHGYIEVDVEQIARDWACDYEVVERPEGGVWVFEPSVRI